MASFLKTSPKVLVVLAGIVWSVGGIMLFQSGLELLFHAQELQDWVWWHGMILLLGVTLGIVQAGTLFKRSCQKNIQRIYQLPDPRLWQFFRPGFFLALAAMISGGILLNQLARGSYFFMLLVASLDFALTISLLGSLPIHWMEKDV